MPAVEKHKQHLSNIMKIISVLWILWKILQDPQGAWPFFENCWIEAWYKIGEHAVGVLSMIRIWLRLEFEFILYQKTLFIKKLSQVCIAGGGVLLRSTNLSCSNQLQL